MKITFKESNTCITQEINGDINISPTFIHKFGYIEGIINDKGEVELQPKDFVFDGKGTAVGLQIK